SAAAARRSTARRRLEAPVSYFRDPPRPNYCLSDLSGQALCGAGQNNSWTDHNNSAPERITGAARTHRRRASRMRTKDAEPGPEHYRAPAPPVKRFPAKTRKPQAVVPRWDSGVEQPSSPAGAACKCAVSRGPRKAAPVRCSALIQLSLKEAVEYDPDSIPLRRQWLRDRGSSRPNLTGELRDTFIEPLL